MVFLASLFGCGQQPTATSAAVPANDTFMIDYAHESGGVFHHGTFSLIDGKIGATWSVDEGGKKNSQDLAMTEDTFRSVWDSLNDIPDFKAGVVLDPNQQLDTSTHHVIGIVFSIGGQKGMRTHMIPADTASPSFKVWLSKIGYNGK